MTAYRREDTVTNSPEDAAEFERMHGEEPYDDGPTLAECQRDEAEANAARTRRDWLGVGMVTE